MSLCNRHVQSLSTLLVLIGLALASLGILFGSIPTFPQSDGVVVYNLGGANSSYFEHCSRTKRCWPIDLGNRLSFVHISKSGGASWIGEIKKIASTIYPNLEDGPEHSVVYQNSLDPFDHLSHHMTSLRSPRHHMWSLWSECRFDGWGKKMTNGTSFPRSGTDAEGDLKDFTNWVQRFVDTSSGEIVLRQDTTTLPAYFNCYHPANYQSRSFVADNYEPHGPREIEELVPNTEIVDKTYWFMDYVAITEFFHESKCLLYHRLTPKTPEMQQYIDDTCHCNPVELEVAHKDETRLHHDGRRRKTMLDLDPALLQTVAALSTSDTHLYQIALPQFLQEISWLEVTLGRRVMCDKILHKWEPEFVYLGFNVTDLYIKTKQSVMEA